MAKQNSTRIPSTTTSASNLGKPISTKMAVSGEMNPEAVWYNHLKKITMMVTGNTISTPPINDWRTKLLTAPRLISLLSSGVEVIPYPIYQPHFTPGGRVHIHFVVDLLFQQRARQRRVNTDPALLRIGLVRTDQAMRHHLALFVFQLDPGTEEDPAGVLGRPVHHHHVIQTA